MTTENKNDSSTKGTENPTTENNQSEESSKVKEQYVTSDQLNRALTSYNKRFEKTLTELLSTITSKKPEQEDSEQTQTQTKTETTSKENKDVLRLQKQLDDLTKKLQSADSEREKALQQATNEKIKAQVLSIISSHKVEKPDQVFRLIRDNIRIDENNNITITVKDPTLGFEDDRPIAEGIKEWLSSEGSHFLPARNVGGSGAVNTQGSTRRNISLTDLRNLKPSELANINLTDTLGKDVLDGLIRP